jgi:hypothetical protein
MSMFGKLEALNKQQQQPKKEDEKAAPAAPVKAPQPAQPVHKDVTEPRNEATNVPTKQRTFHREKIRHTFDIYDDQLLSLREIAIERQKIFGERVLLGDLVQEALDMLISKERNKE